MPWMEGVFIQSPDMKDWLKQHDLVYECAPAEWESGIPLANGDIGALVWGDGNPFKITLDKYDAWELRSPTPADPRYNYADLRKLVESKQFDVANFVFRNALRRPGDVYPTRLPMPRMELDFGSSAEEFEARLSLYDATVDGTLKLESGRVDWQAFVHADRNLLILELQYDGDVKLRDCKVRLDHLDIGAKETLKKWGYPEPSCGKDERYEWLRQPFPAGGEYLIMWRRTCQGPRETVLLTIATHNDSLDPFLFAHNTLEKAAQENREGLRKEHVGFWHGFWRRSFLTLPDPRLENLFYIEMYKLACSSREGKYPCSLQGLWTKDGGMPPWSGDYHLDMNVEETYWPVYASNHLELGQPLYERFWQNLPRFQRMCRDFFGFEGAWSRCEMGLDGAPIYGYYTTNFWPGNGAWLAHHYWLHWRFSQDRRFLRERAYPFMRAFMQTYLNLLERWEDGRYHMPLSNSPEWGEGDGEAWGSDTTCDLGLIRWLAGALLEAVKTLDINDTDAPRWRDVLDHLVEYPQDASGLLVFAGQPLSHSHRHHSHLMPIHPLGTLNVEGSEADRSLIARSLRALRQRGTGEWTGWSFPWASLIAARARRPQMAWQMLQLYLGFIKPNSFHVNGDPREFGASVHTYQPMTLEAGFCAAAAIMEMLLQSWGGRIRVFPAVPEFWHDAYFHRLRAEGAFLVTAKLRDGVVRFVEIESEVGGPCRVANPFEGKVTVTNLTRNEKLLVSGDVIEFPTMPKETYRLTPAGLPIAAENLSYTSFERRSSECNWFGVKRLPRF